MAPEESTARSLVIESGLQAFFFERLNEVNKKTLQPLPQEVIYYSSIVMDRFGESKNYFHKSGEGKVREKVLGKKLLESAGMPRNEQIKELKDIGETALFVCGYFSDSLNKKLVSTSYYGQIGQSSYKKLNVFLPTAFDLKGFYALVAEAFDALATIMNIVAQRLSSKMEEDFVLLIGDKCQTKVS